MLQLKSCVARTIKATIVGYISVGTGHGTSHTHTHTQRGSFRSPPIIFQRIRLSDGKVEIGLVIPAMR